VNPKLFIIAGPNGAGKTTFASQFLPRFTSSREFVNADEIAQRISPAHPEKAAFQAARKMLTRINHLASQKVDFAIETTLAGKSYVPLLKGLRTSGYEIHLYYLWLPDVQMAVDRVAERVRKGGHNIPEPVIRRRYVAGIRNLFGVYRPILSAWSLFDNSKDLRYPIARETDSKLMVLDSGAFEKCCNMATKPTDDAVQESAKPPDWLAAVMALRLAKAQVIAEHAATGRPLIVWRDGKIYRQPPDEAKRELEALLKSDPWASMILPVR
jgi:predicted ABC-type ATPase